MKQKIEFLYLTEEEMIASGVTDMARCIDVMTEVFELLSKGDYVMGGSNRNSHGVEIGFPKASPFPNMPLDSPDRRFMAMCAYLGGRFDLCGEKWYGSNIENRKNGLPRSIHTVVLNDQHTGAPIAIMPGNLISSMRTGAVPGVGAKYLAAEKAGTLGLVGAGVINKTCAMGILTARSEISAVKIYDLHEEAAENLCQYLRRLFDVEASPASCIRDAVCGADIVNVATAGAIAPRLEPEWLKTGALLSLPAIAEIPREFLEGTKVVVDNWKLYEAWRDELARDPRTYHEKLELIGGDLIDYVLEGTMNPNSFTNLGDIIRSTAKGRETQEEIIIFAMGGMPVEDVAWAYQVYENARLKGLGKSLSFWDKPYML